MAVVWAWPAVVKRFHSNRIIAKSIPMWLINIGIPVLRFNVKWSENEINQAKHMKETFKEIMHNMGRRSPGVVKMMKKTIMDCPGPVRSFMKPAPYGWETILSVPH